MAEPFTRTNTTTISIQSNWPFFVAHFNLVGSIPFSACGERRVVNGVQTTIWLPLAIVIMSPKSGIY
jgi:hypothetical protein